MNSFRACKLQFGESRCRKSLGKCSNTSFKPSLQPVKTVLNDHITTILESLPSGKHTENYGKSLFFMGKSTINRPFSIAFCMFTRG